MAIISGIDSRSKQPVVLTESVTRGGPATADTNVAAPAGIVFGASASATALADQNGLSLTVAAGVQTLNQPPAQAEATADGALSDVIRVLEMADTEATQVVEFLVTDAQGNPNTWSPATVTLNGENVATELNSPLAHTVTTPSVELAGSSVSMNGALRMAFASQDSEGDHRTVQIAIARIAFLDRAGHPVSGFSYSTDSGNSYPVTGGRFVPAAISGSAT